MLSSSRWVKRSALALGAAGLLGFTTVGVGVGSAQASGVGGHWRYSGYPIFAGPQTYYPEIGKTNSAHSLCIYSVNSGGWVRVRDLTNGQIGYQTVAMVAYASPAWTCS